MPHDLIALQNLAYVVGCKLAPKDAPVEIVIKYTSGRKTKLPLNHVEDAPRESLVPDVRPGWDFTGRIPRYDGTECPEITGRPLAVLRVLAAANGPVSVDELRKAWEGYPADDSTIRGAVGSLRKKLERLWPDWEGEVIVSTGAGYGLELR